MARYEVVLRQSILKDLEPVPNKDVKRILAAIKSLAGNPRPPQSRKLSDGEKYRLRIVTVGFCIPSRTID